jgi:hypothetical protein
MNRLLAVVGSGNTSAADPLVPPEGNRADAAAAVMLGIMPSEKA